MIAVLLHGDIVFPAGDDGVVAKALRTFLLVCVSFSSACAGPTTKQVEIDKTAIEREAQSQRELFVERFLEDEVRLQSLTYRMSMSGAKLCGERVDGFAGFTHANLHSWPKRHRDAAKESMGMGGEVVITTVVHDSPAHTADIRRGDIIVEIDRQPLGAGKKALKKAKRILKKSLQSPTVSMTLRRDGQLLEREFAPVMACGSRLKLSLAPEVNAYADGSKVVVTRGMLRFADDDLKLATVIAHEMAHNAMGHRDKQRKNHLFGIFLDTVAKAYGVNTHKIFRRIGRRAFSQDFELEADYVGLYIMHASGLPTDQAADFWRDMGAEHPGSIQSNYLGTHPGTAKRYLALEKISLEIDQKVAMGVDVRPTGKSEEFTFDESYRPALAGTHEESFERAVFNVDQGNYAQALGSFQALADGGNAAAANELAKMHTNGLGTDQNLDIAGAWLIKAAAGGNQDARRKLPVVGRELADGEFDSLPLGQFLLATAFWNGFGVDKDRARGRELFQMSAEGDYVPAQLRVAALYTRGDGVLQSFDESLRWYSRAAMGGDTGALRVIGVKLADGYGSPEHRSIAYAILNSFAANDDAEAVLLRDELAQTLETDELRRGQMLSREISEGRLTALQALAP